MSSVYERILIPTDGSGVAGSAAEAGINLAVRFDAELHIVYMVETERLAYLVDESRRELSRRGKEAVEEIEQRAEDAGVSTETRFLDEKRSVHRGILGYADEQDTDLVVMGTHGRTGVGRVVLGSVAEQTLRESEIPVMTLNERTVTDSDLESILVPVDGSESALTAVDHALDLASATEGSVSFLNVVNHATIAGLETSAGTVIDALEQAGERIVETASDRAQKRGVQVEDTSVQVGSPFRTILEYADRNDIDSLVMGTHGRSGIDRLLLGSVTERVIRQIDVPVIAIKAPQPES
jgi:nucleotide-binding universal stress UspA family protein